MRRFLNGLFFIFVLGCILFFVLILAIAAEEKNFIIDNPTTWTDGTELKRPNLEKWELGCASTSQKTGTRQYTRVVELSRRVDGIVRSYRHDFSPGDYYCAWRVRAWSQIEKKGIWSKWSNEVRIVITATAVIPKPPVVRVAG